MIAISQRTQNPRVNIIDILSELTGSAAINFQRFSYKYLEEGKRYFLINLKHVRKIDGLGFMVLEQFINRGGHIRLFNVGAEIRCMLKMSGKDAIFKVYNETDCHEVVSLFEKEGIEEGVSRDGIKKRRYPRVDTLFRADFKYLPEHNETISGRATIRNLSEGGVFAEQIMAVSTKSEETIKQSRMSGQELYDIKFRLNGYSEHIKTNGICTREIKAEDKYCAGIRFMDMEKDQKEMINNYVINT